MKFIKLLAVGLAVSLPLAAANADDAAYCNALNATARSVGGGGNSAPPVSVTEAMTTCNASSISVLEKYITDNKGTLPKRN